MENFAEHKPNLIEKLFFSDKIAKKIFDENISPKLKKYSKVESKNSSLQNILHINTAAGKGGASKIAHELLNKSLNQKGINSKILVNESFLNDDSIDILEHTNPNLHRLLHKYQRKNGLVDFFNVDSFNIKNLEIFKNADILHLHNLHGNYFSLFNLPEMTALKSTIWTLHDEYALTGHCAFALDCEKWQTGCGNCPNLSAYPKLKKDTTKYLFDTKQKIYENSNFTVVCYSNWLKDKLSKSILKDKDIRLIYNGINEKTFVNTDKNEARIKLNLPLNKKILLFSANGGIRNPQKGGEYILKTYEHFKCYEDIIFVCIGGKNKEINAPNWIDIPYINDETTMALYYSAADLFIYPSLAETFGLVLAEAMSCELPIVTFKNSAIQEVVAHNETGYLAENENIDDFINGINYFIDNEPIRKQFSKQARERVLEKFTLDRMIEEYIILYREIYEKCKVY
jgi:glycosyltransferase involved in cell wall biosynthesis